MSLWERAKSFFSRQRAPQVDPLRLLSQPYGSFGGGGRTYPQRGAQEALDLYERSPWLRAVSGLVGKTVASHGWKLYRAPDDAGSFRVAPRNIRTAEPRQRRALLQRAVVSGELEEVTQHPMLRLFDQPNALIDGRAARQTTVCSYDIAGEAAWIIIRNGVGAPESIYPVPGTWVRRMPSIDDPTYEILLGGQQYAIPAADVVMIIDPNPANPYGRGVGLGVAMGDELDIDEYAAKTVSAWFQNRAVPNAIVSIKGANSDSLRRSSEEWSQILLGFEKAYRTVFLPADVDVHRFDTTFAEQQLVELRSKQRDTIQQIFGVPPERLGIMVNSNRATSEAAEMHDARSVQVPRLETLRAAYQRVANMFDDRLLVEYDDPVPEDKAARVEVMRSFPGRFTINEEREQAGLPPIPKGEGFLVPAGFVHIVSHEDLVPAPAPAFGSLSAAPSQRALPPSRREVSLSPPEGARDEAAKGLRWVEEFRRGGTSIGRTTARMIVDGRLTESRVRRMARYFDRHEVDKQGEGWSPGEDGFPSNGRIAWALWGGDEGRRWANKIVAQLEREEDRAARPRVRMMQLAEWMRILSRAVDGADVDVVLEAADDVMKEQGSLAIKEAVDATGQPLPVDTIDTSSKRYQAKRREIKKRVQKLINDTTKQDLRDIIETSESDDEAQDQIAEYFAEAQEVRVPMIAETETVNYANFASIQALDDAGLTVQKEWIASIGAATPPRPAHAALDGQMQDMDAPFVVPDIGTKHDGAQAQYPGDFGVAALDIRCRCVVGTAIEALRSHRALPEQRAAYWRKRDDSVRALEPRMREAFSALLAAQLAAIMAEIE